jgi:hypothetical protein
MPVHDWTRVDAGIFRDFHLSWITHLMESLNGGLLPAGYYTLSEQHFGRLTPDILTLHIPETELSPEATYRARRRTLVIRRERGHRIVALVEIAAPGNKDREVSAADFVDKVESALGAGCHVVVIDLFPSGPNDPRGFHGALWERYGEEQGVAPEQPLVLASYVAGRLPEAYVAAIAVGDPLPEMPLFLTPDAYVPLPLEATYQAAFRGMPAYSRGVIEAPGRSGA